MDPAWMEDFFSLVLKTDAALRARGEDNFLDFYLGPADLRLADGYSPPDFASLAGFAQDLRAALPGQALEAERYTYLDRQLLSLETLCQLYTQNDPNLQAASAIILDVVPEPVPEARLEQARQLFDQALPGSGSLAERYAAFEKAVTLPPALADGIVPLLERWFTDLRSRVVDHIALPPGESLDLQPRRGVPYGAANYYLGGFRSRFELNLDRPVNLFMLLYQLCHEAYPGHHTEFCLKDWLLVQARGWHEHQVFFISPQLVLTEGLATVAVEMLFTPQQAVNWLVAQVLSPLGIDLSAYDLTSLWQASILVQGDELGANLILRRWAGASDAELIDYVYHYRPVRVDLIAAILGSYNTPLRQIYALSYAQGRRLLSDRLVGPQRWDVFRRVLTEPLTPGML